MTQKNLVSVVVVAYNNWPDLALAIESALCQSHQPVEVIVVDNSSTDATPQELERRFGPRIRMVRQENKGDAGAYNSGARLAQGEFLQFLDGDDVLAPDKFEKQLAVFRAAPGTDIVHGDIRNFQSLPERSWWADHATRDYDDMVAAVLDLEGRCLQSPLSMLMRRGAFERVGPWDASVYCTDFDFFLRAAWLGCRFRHCPGLMGFSRIHPKQMSADRGAMERGTEAVLRKALTYIDKQPHRSLVERTLRRHLVHLAVAPLRRALRRLASRDWLLNILLLLGTFAGLYAGTEAVLGLTLYRFAQYPTSPGPGADYRIDSLEFKTTVRTNSLNLRGAQVAPKAAGESRILALGDSFTFGLGVDEEDAYPKVLEDLLKVKVLNGGIGGAAPEALAFLKASGLGLRPDIVIEQVYIGNDFYDGLDDLSASKAKKPLRAGSYTASFLWNRLIQFPMVDELLYRLDLRYGERGIYLKDYPALEKRLMAIQLSALGEMNRILKEHGVRLLVMIVPSREQIFMADVIDPDKYDLRKPNRLLTSFCATEHIPCIDLAALYDRLPPREVRSFYYVQDLHWTPKGHRHAASVLAGALVRK